MSGWPCAANFSLILLLVSMPPVRAETSASLSLAGRVPSYYAVQLKNITSPSALGTNGSHTARLIELKNDNNYYTITVSADNRAPLDDTAIELWDNSTRVELNAGGNNQIDTTGGSEHVLRLKYNENTNQTITFSVAAN